MYEIGARRAGHVLARAAAAALGAKPPLHAEVRERVDALARDEIDAAAVAAVAAVRTAARDELLAPKADAAAAAGAGLDANVGFIDEFHASEALASGETKKPRTAGLRIEPRRARATLSPRRTLTMRRLFGPLTRERDAARDARVQRVVAAHPDVGAGVILRTALAHDDVAREHLLAAEALDAESFRLRIAAVPGAAACFLVCHLAAP